MFVDLLFHDEYSIHATTVAEFFVVLVQSESQNRYLEQLVSNGCLKLFVDSYLSVQHLQLTLRWCGCVIPVIHSWKKCKKN